MGINRVSTGYLVNQAVNFLNINQGLLSDLQTKLSTGKNINNPSDDPVGLTRILNLTNTLKTDERFARNVDHALSEVSLADTTLSNMTDLIHRARELAVQGANFTQNQNGLDAMALEIDQIINQMVQLGNTSLGGRYIFGGKETGTPPFDRPAGTDDINYVGNAPADAWQRPVEVSENVVMDVNINGQLLLGQAIVTAPGAPGVAPTFGAGSGGVFQTLVSLKQNMENGSYDQIRLNLDELDTDLNTVLAQQARIGSITNRLELTKARIDDRKAIFTQQYAAIQDIDTAKVISDLNFQENVFQSSLAVTGRVLQSSLLDFLR